MGPRPLTRAGFALAGVLAGCAIAFTVWALYPVVDAYPELRSIRPLTATQARSRLDVEAARESEPTRRAVLRGLGWLVTFLQPPERFEAVFTDYVLALDELARHREDELVSALARNLLHEAFDRAAPRLKQIFPATASGEWDFISVLELLHRHRIANEAFLEHHRTVLAGHASRDRGSSFAVAYRARDYDRLGDLLINQSFLHRFNEADPHHQLELPADRFEDWLRLGARIPAIHRYASDEDAYHDQNYYFTHVVLVLTGYGAEPVDDLQLRADLLAYLQEHYPTVHDEVGDLDLLGEFAQCFKLLGAADAPEVERAIRSLLARQNEDGSWGVASDFDGSTYDAMHPTWAALTALYASSPGPAGRGGWRGTLSRWLQ